MNTADREYSLLAERWISCMNSQGQPGRVSIREVFDGSVEVRAIQGESAAQDYAVFRLLLAIYWRAHQREVKVPARESFDMGAWFDRQSEALDTGRADDTVLHYLDEYAERFDLLHQTMPFMQVADLHTEKGTYSEIRRIVPEAEADYFTMRTGRGRETLSLPEAARWLVYTQAYDYSGIKSGAVGDRRVKGGKGYPIGTGWSGMTGGTVIVGADLRRTLLLNTTESALLTATDHPVWERDPDTAEERSNPYPAGPSDLATWQSRRIRLHVDGDRAYGVLVSNGDKIPDAGANAFGDPMTPYRYSKNKSKRDRQVYYPKYYDADRTMWRSLEPLIVLGGDPGIPGETAPRRPENIDQLAKLDEAGSDVPDLVDLQLVSVEYGPQASSVASEVTSRLGVPAELLREDAGMARRVLLDTATATSQAAGALGSFAGQLLVAAGGEYAFQPDPTDRMLTALEPRFANWLRKLEVSNLEDRVTRWQRDVREAVLEDARTLLRGAGPKALAGREVDRSDDGRGRISSAGTAYRWLLRKLDEALPLTRTEQPQEVGK
jgi:CRISPR system Cascade subunit CasA